MSETKSYKITICGFGLIGGCMALDLQNTNRHINVTAYDKPAVLTRLKRDKHFKVTIEKSLAKALLNSDIVILSAPHRANEELLQRIAKIDLSKGCLIIDTGAVKVPIASLAEKLHFNLGVEFIASHPMAGREKSGFENSASGLFAGHAWFLDSEKKLMADNKKKLNWMVKALKAKPVYLSSQLHDKLVSEISHLPQLLSTLLGAQIHSALVELSGPGLRSMLRLAGSPYSVWSEIIELNKEEIEKSLLTYRDNLNELITKIENKNSLADVFKEAARSYKCLS